MTARCVDCLALASILLVPLVSATTCRVPGDCSTIQAAIDAAMILFYGERSQWRFDNHTVVGHAGNCAFFDATGVAPAGSGPPYFGFPAARDLELGPPFARE